MIKQILTSILLWVFFSGNVVAQLTSDEENAREKGIVLYKQSDWYDSQPLLEIAAKAGDQTAQYYLAEAIRLSKRYTNAEAKKWYEAAAKQGNLYAMLRLGDSDDLCGIIGTCDGKSAEQWRKQAIETAYERANNGDTEAMIVLYTVGKGLRWLERSAESGNNNAQHFLAITYKDGGGWFIIPGNREKAVERWAKASAESGYVPAMEFYANFLYDNQRSNQEIAYWFKRTAESGHLAALGSYAMNLAHLPEGFGYPLNLVEAYGITYLITQLTGGGGAPIYARRNLPEIAAKMTPEEIQQGIAFSKEWEKTHPPLSYYPPVYGY